MINTWIDMPIHKLMIKTHRDTGLKYLCYTRRKDHDEYLGSGIAWLRHLKKYGANIITEVIFQSKDVEEFKRVAISKSKEFNVVESKEWANLKHEEGDGGDTVSNKMWITNGQIDKYILKTDLIPDGWRKGRTRCIFHDVDKQVEFSKRVNFEARGLAIKKAWDDGKMDHRDHSKCGTSGEDNPSKRPEVREKIRQSALSESVERSERMKRVKPWLKRIYGNNPCKQD